MQDIVSHFCLGATQSVFCQLSQGLVRQYIDSVAAHNNDQFMHYLDSFHTQQCSDPNVKSQKKCKVFPVLRKGIPGTGLTDQVAVSTAAAGVQKGTSSLQAARKLREIAQAAAKRSPTKVTLDSLEKATQQEYQAEKA